MKYIIVMDNVFFYYLKEVENIILIFGYDIMFLFVYFLFLNLIEYCWLFWKVLIKK